MVCDDDIAGKQLGHACRIKVYDEFFQLQGKGQFLNHYTLTNGYDRRLAGRAFGDKGIAAEGQITQTQTMTFRNFSNNAITDKSFFIKQPLLRTNRQTGVEQTTDTDNHNGRVREDVSQLVGRTLFGSQQRCLAFLHQLHLIAI